MAKVIVEQTHSFNEWREDTNKVSTGVGDADVLSKHAEQTYTDIRPRSNNLFIGTDANLTIDIVVTTRTEKDEYGTLRTVRHSDSMDYDINVISGGLGYTEGDIIVVEGHFVGGTTGIQDLYLQVMSVEGTRIVEGKGSLSHTTKSNSIPTANLTDEVSLLREDAGVSPYHTPLTVINMSMEPSAIPMTPAVQNNYTDAINELDAYQGDVNILLDKPVMKQMTSAIEHHLGDVVTQGINTNNKIKYKSISDGLDQVDFFQGNVSIDVDKGTEGNKITFTNISDGLQQVDLLQGNENIKTNKTGTNVKAQVASLADNHLGDIVTQGINTGDKETFQSITHAVNELDDLQGNVNIKVAKTTGNKSTFTNITDGLQQVDLLQGDVNIKSIKDGVKSTFDTITDGLRQVDEFQGNVNILSSKTTGKPKSTFETITDAVKQMDDFQGNDTLETVSTTVTSAINEHESDIGKVQNLTTTAKVLTPAVNELDAEIGNETLLTTAQTIKGAINEHETDIGTVANLTTEAKELTSAVNELDSEVGDLDLVIDLFDQDYVHNTDGSKRSITDLSTAVKVIDDNIHGTQAKFKQAYLGNWQLAEEHHIMGSRGWTLRKVSFDSQNQEHLQNYPRDAADRPLNPHSGDGRYYNYNGKLHILKGYTLPSGHIWSDVVNWGIDYDVVNPETQEIETVFTEFKQYTSGGAYDEISKISFYDVYNKIGKEDLRSVEYSTNDVTAISMTGAINDLWANSELADAENPESATYLRRDGANTLYGDLNLSQTQASLKYSKVGHSYTRKSDMSIERQILSGTTDEFINNFAVFTFKQDTVNNDRLVGGTERLTIRSTDGLVTINDSLKVNEKITGSELQIDNIRLIDNSISTINTNGNLIIQPHGTGWVKFTKVHINGTLDVDGNVDIDGTTYLDKLKFDSDTISNLASNGDVKISAARNIVMSVGNSVTVDKQLNVNGRTYLDQTDINTTDGIFKISGTNKVDIDANMDIDGTVDIDGITYLDNLKFNANTISANNTDGDIVLTPNGTGWVKSNKLDINGTLDVDGTTYLDNLKFDGNTILANNANGDIVLTPHGNGWVKTNKLDINGTLDVDGTTTLDHMKFDGNTISTTNTNGTLWITPSGTGEVYIPKVLNVNGRTHLDQTDIVTTDGIFKISGNNKVDIQSDVTMSKTLNVNGRTYLDQTDINTTDGVFTISGANKVDINSNMDIDAVVDIDGRLDVDNIRLDGNTISTINGNGTLYLTPNGTGQVNIPKVLNVNGRTYLDQTDISTTDGIFKISGTNKVDIDATVDIDGTLDVDGVTYLDNLKFDSNTILANNANGDIVLTPNGTGWVKTNKLDINGTLDVDGTTYLDNMKFDVNTISTTNTNGSLTLNPNGTGYVYIPKVLNVNGRTYLDQTDIDTTDGIFKISGTNKVDIDATVDIDGITYLDNLKFNSNTISATNANGDIVLTPNGTGWVKTNKLDINGTLDVDGVTTLDHMKFDTSTISTTNANGHLYLTPNGTGQVYIEKVLNVNGRTHLDQTDIVTTDGAFRISGANKVDIDSNMDIDANMDIDGTVDINGATTIETSSGKNFKVNGTGQFEIDVKEVSIGTGNTLYTNHIHAYDDDIVLTADTGGSVRITNDSGLCIGAGAKSGIETTAYAVAIELLAIKVGLVYNPPLNSLLLESANSSYVRGDLVHTAGEVGITMSDSTEALRIASRITTSGDTYDWFISHIIPEVLKREDLASLYHIGYPGRYSTTRGGGLKEEVSPMWRFKSKIAIDTINSGQTDQYQRLSISIGSPDIQHVHIDKSLVVEGDLNVNSRTYLGQTDIDTAKGIFKISGANKVDIDSDMDIDAVVDIDGRLDVDNIRLDGNTISTINANGNINLTPNGVGKIYISKVLDVNGRTYLDQTDINTADGILLISGANKVDIRSDVTMSKTLKVSGSTTLGVTYATKPASSSNDTRVATTSWVRSHTNPHTDGKTVYVNMYTILGWNTTQALAFTAARKSVTLVKGDLMIVRHQYRTSHRGNGGTSYQYHSTYTMYIMTSATTYSASFGV